MKSHYLRLVSFIGLAVIALSFQARAEDEPVSLTKIGLGKYGRVLDRDAADPVNLGPTGAVGWPVGREIVVTGVDAGSPADGLLLEGDIILAVNGKMLEIDPRRTLGRAITDSESPSLNGRLELTVWQGGEKKQVVLALPVMGDYSPTWPVKCAKSKRILHNTCEWLSQNQLTNGLFLTCSGTDAITPCAVNGLVFLASGEPGYIENARRLAYHLVRTRMPRLGKDDGLANWSWSYSAVFLSEYYLLTGDSNVLPYLKDLQKWIADGQTECGSWSYGPKTSKPSEENVNQVGLTCFLATVLIRECGVEVDEKVLDRSRKFFERFMNNESIAYGDHRPWAEAAGSGKDAQAAIIFRMLGGDRTASAYFAQRVADLYPWMEKAPTGPYFSVLWSPPAASLAQEKWFRRFMDNWQWYYDLSRTWTGGFLLPPTSIITGNQYTMRGPLFTTGAAGLMYGLGEKRLQMLGAPRSLFSRVKVSPRLDWMRKLFAQKKFAEGRKFADQQSGDLLPEEKKHGEQLLAAIELMDETLRLTCCDITNNVANNNLSLARVQIEDLKMLFNKDVLSAVPALIDKPEHKHVYDAEKAFEENQYLCPVDVDARKKIEQLASDTGIGSVQVRAKEVLKNSRQWPSYRSCFTSEEELNIYGGRWGGDKPDKSALKIADKLAHIPGRFWTYLPARKALEKAGIPREGCIGDLLIGTVDRQPGEWRYLYPAPGDAVKDWQGLGFDDSKWNKGTRLFAGKDGWDARAGRMILRGCFELKQVNYDRIIIYCRTDTPADLYLNGELVGKFLRDTDGWYESFRLSKAAASLLKKGANVLAMSAESKDGGIVMSVGLQGIPSDSSEHPVQVAAVNSAKITEAAPVPPVDEAPEYNLSGKSVEELIKLFGDDSGMVRWLAAAAFEVKAEDSVTELEKCLSHKNPLVRQGGALALGYMGAQAEKSIPGLLKLLKKDKEPFVRRYAADTIGYIASAKEGDLSKVKEVVPALVKSLKDENYNVRDSAARALGNIGPNASPAIPDLTKALQDGEWWVRESAAKALTNIDPPGNVVRPILEKAAETEKHRWVLKALGKPITGVDMPIDVDNTNAIPRS